MPRTLATHEADAAADIPADGCAQRPRTWLTYTAIVVASVLSAVLQPGHAEATGHGVALLDTLPVWDGAASATPAVPASAP